MIHPRPGLILVPLALSLCACGQRAGTSSTGGATAGSGSASAAPVASSGAPATSSVVPAVFSASPPKASAVPLDPPAGAPSPTSFVGARSEKACKAQTVEIATYQQRGELALAGSAGGVAAVWRVKLAGKPQQQVAFASFDTEGRRVASPRGVGQTANEAPLRVLASGTEWTAIWFDEKGLAYTRPRQETLPPPDIAHLSAVGPDVASDVALASSPANAVLAATPFGADRAQLGLFLFAPAEPGGPAVKALGVTHHGKQPHRSAVAAGPAATFLAWDEGGAVLASRFDTAGRESDSPCTIAPAGQPRERLMLAAVGAGAVAMWMEGGKVRTRALDASGCPASPIWTVAEGKLASITSLGESAVVAWVSGDGKLLAVRLGVNGAPGERGLEAAEGSSGVKDTPALAAMGSGKVAFGWSEAMSPVISTRRLVARVIDAACIP